MRALLSTLVLMCVSIPAIAVKPQYPQPGSFRYEDSYKVEIKKRFETVVAFTDAGAKRLEQLWKQGYECHNTGRQIYLCSAFEATEGTEGEVADRVSERLGGSTIVIHAREADPELVSKGTSFEEWLVKQPISFRGKTYSGYRYQILKGSEEMHKIALGTDTTTEDGFVVNVETGEWVNYFDFAKTESQWVYRLYMVGGVFRRM